MKKKFINLAVVLFFVGVTIYVVVANSDIRKLPELVKQMDMKYFGMGAGLMVLYLTVNGIQIKDLVKSTGYSINLAQGFFLGLVGMYYSLITPFATGGQPGQIYVMKRQYGIPVSVGTSVTLKKCIIYQVTITILVISMFVYQLNFFRTTQPKILPLVMIGVMTNLVGSIFLILSLYNSKLLIGIIRPLLNFITKFKMFKKINKDRIYKMIYEYSDVMNTMKKKKLLMLRQFMITIVQLIVFFSITYFIYLSFGYSDSSFTQIFALQVILYSVVSFIPTPGGAGVSELGFYSIFATFFVKEVIIYATIMWRIINYYAIIMLGGFVLLINTLLINRKNKTSTKTYIRNTNISNLLTGDVICDSINIHFSE